MAQNKELLLDRLNLEPPFAIYFLARDSKRKLAHPGTEEIARRSGLSERKVIRLSNSITWENVTLRDFDRFCSACGVSFLTSTKSWNYLRAPHADYFRKLARGVIRNPMRHLSTRQRIRFDALCKKWASSI